VSKYRGQESEEIVLSLARSRGHPPWMTDITMPLTTTIVERTTEGHCDDFLDMRSSSPSTAWFSVPGLSASPWQLLFAVVYLSFTCVSVKEVDCCTVSLTRWVARFARKELWMDYHRPK